MENKTQSQITDAPSVGCMSGLGGCPICNETVTSNDDFFVHVYLTHPEVNDNISKMLNGEKYKTAEQLREEGVLPPNSGDQVLREPERTSDGSKI